MLRGDAASFTTFLKILVPLWMVSNDPPEWVRRSGVATVPVASLDVKVVISVAEVEADEETWQAIETLHYGPKVQNFVTPSNVHL